MSGPPPGALSVYGIVPGDATAPPGTFLVRRGDVAAVVRERRHGEAAARREELVAHHRVLSVIAAQGDVVPMRFGVVLDDEEAVREELLAAYAPRLAHLLGRLRGQVQLTIKAVYEPQVALREAAASDPRIRRLRAATSGRSADAARGALIELGELVARGLERVREADERRVLEAVGPIATDFVVETPKHERLAAHVHVLVMRHRREALDDVVARLAREQEGRLAFRYLGPLPPYSFADLDLAAEEAAWA